MVNYAKLTLGALGALQSFFPTSLGKLRIDNQKMLIGVIFLHRNGLRWYDASKNFTQRKTTCNCWKRWNDVGVYARIMTGLVADKTRQRDHDRCHIPQSTSHGFEPSGKNGGLADRL